MIRSLTQLLLVLGSLGAAGVAVFLLRYLYQHRANPGAGWFMGNIASVAVFCAAYGVGLLVFTPLARLVLESIAFVALCFMGPFFLAFGLDYTGRGELIRRPLFGVVAGVPLVAAVLVASNPLHGLVWQNFRLAPVFGAATVQYALQPVGVVTVLFSVLTGGVGSLALIEAILDYGQLYRREATAVVLSTVPPTVGVTLWLFDIGPVPQLNLTAVFMLVHLSLDSYAFVGTHMFETNPATQRAAEQSALDDLNEPLLVLDTAEQVVNLNSSAERLFDLSRQASFPVPVSTVTGVERDAMVAAEELARNGRLFAVSVTPLTDQSGDSVGEMVVLYDITAQREREQQLSVLNRVLRHNLRNEMTVIRGRAEAIQADPSDSPTVQAGAIVAASDRLLSIVGNIRDSERVLQDVTEPAEVDLLAATEAIRDDISDRFPDADIEIQNALSDTRVSTQPAVLGLALENLVENAVVHADQDGPAVSIHLGTSEESPAQYQITVADTNPEIPDIELSSLRAGEERPLEHGKGLGLWTAERCVSALNGALRFEYADGNAVTLTFPET